MFCGKTSPIVFSSFAGIAALSLSFLSGCGAGPLSTGSDSAGSYAISGIIHGGPNPVIGATITLYATTSSGYGATATVVATTTTNSSGDFSLTLPTASVACPAGEYAYVAAYQGSTGGSNNANSLLMVPIGACSTNFSSIGTGPYVNTYLGSNVWIDELTTAVSAYALGNFMTVTNAGVINIGAPANNLGTASIGSSSVSPSVAGLAHAFANALAIINVNTGQPNAYTNGGSSATTGGAIPVAEINLLGNILQACVNSVGVTGTNTATANDGTGCGMLFSFTTPPQSGAAVPTNTMQAMVDLAKYPNPSVNTWNSGCTAAGSGTKTATSCLFNLAPSIGAYSGALTSAPPDWSLAVVYTSGYGANSTATGCTTSPFCPGLTYPFYVALDYEDNVYVLNYDGFTGGTLPPAANTWSNIIGITNAGAPIFATPESTTYKYTSMIATDLAGHIIAPNAADTNPSPIEVYSNTSGSIVGSASYTNLQGMFALVDPSNDLYVSGYIESVNLRKYAYGGTSSAPTYTIGATNWSAISIITSGAVYQMAFDSNLDIYQYLDPAYDGGSGSPYICLLNNQSSSPYAYMSTTPPAYTQCTTGGNTAVAVPGNTGSGVIAAGIAPTSTGALAIGSTGFTKVTKSANSSTATLSGATTTAIPAVNSVLYSRYVSVDGNNWGYSPDGANGAVASGISVFDSVDTLALGTYKGCFVTASACGTGVTAGTGQAPMASPRDAAIDSSGDIWVVSGNTADLTELIGAAAPAWPGLSMAKFGLPQ